MLLCTQPEADYGSGGLIGHSDVTCTILAPADLVHEEFFLPINCDRFMWGECACGEKNVIVLVEELDLGSVENGEARRVIQQLQGDCGMLFISGGNVVRSIESWHELSCAVFITRSVISSAVCR